MAGARASGWTLLAGVAAVLALPGLAAHVPSFDVAGSTPATAFVVEDPDKSWVFYDEVGSVGRHWFRFDAAAGQELTLSMHVPPKARSAPSLWLLGPGLPPGAPEGAPAGLGAIAVPPESRVNLEPFSPLAMKDAGSWRGAAPEAGTYYALVEAPPGTTYSLAIGARESFTAQEWMLVPVQRPSIQSWGGVPWPVAVAGEAIAVVAAAVAARALWAQGPRVLVGTLGAWMVAGTALSVLLLAAIAVARAGWSGVVVIPIVFALLALGIGAAAWRTVQLGKPRWQGAVWGVAAIVAWAGFIVGPLLLLAWAALPDRRDPQAR